jgi:hypothetical protein
MLITWFLPDKSINLISLFGEIYSSSTDNGEVVSNYAPAHPAFQSHISSIPTTLQAKAAFEEANTPFDSRRANDDL